MTRYQKAYREHMHGLGYDVELEDFLLTDSAWALDDHGRGRPFKAVRIVYTARVVGGTLGTLEVGGSTDHAAWLTWDEIEATDRRVSLLTRSLEVWRRMQP